MKDAENPQGVVAKGVQIALGGDNLTDEDWTKFMTEGPPPLTRDDFNKSELMVLTWENYLNYKICMKAKWGESFFKGLDKF